MIATSLSWLLSKVTSNSPVGPAAPETVPNPDKPVDNGASRQRRTRAARARNAARDDTGTGNLSCACDFTPAIHITKLLWSADGTVQGQTAEAGTLGIVVDAEFSATPRLDPRLGSPWT